MHFWELYNMSFCLCISCWLVYVGKIWILVYIDWWSQNMKHYRYYRFYAHWHLFDTCPQNTNKHLIYVLSSKQSCYLNSHVIHTVMLSKQSCYLNSHVIHTVMLSKQSCYLNSHVIHTVMLSKQSCYPYIHVI